jgi:hypothetical protein
MTGDVHMAIGILRGNVVLGKGDMQLRPIELGRAAWGAAMLFAPRLVLERVHGVDTDTTAVMVARILGARHLVQAALSGIDPSPEVLAMGVWVDTAHASSALALAAVDHSRARAGIIDGVVALGWAGIGYRDLRSAHATPPAHDRRRDALARGVMHFLPGARPLARAAARDRHSTKFGRD